MFRDHAADSSVRNHERSADFRRDLYVDCRVIRKGDVLVKWGPMDQHLIREAIFDADDTKSPICFHLENGRGDTRLALYFYRLKFRI